MKPLDTEHAASNESSTSHGDRTDGALSDLAMSNIGDDLRTILAILHPVSDDLVELTLSALPFAQRAQLEAYEIVQGDQRYSNLSMVVLTPFGRRFSAACAREQEPQAVKDAISALDDARADWEATRDRSCRGDFSNRKT